MDQHITISNFNTHGWLYSTIIELNKNFIVVKNGSIKR